MRSGEGGGVPSETLAGEQDQARTLAKATVRAPYQVGYGSRRRPARDGLLPTMAPQARKSTQRERLLNGMIEVADRRGYAGASVSAVIAEAGVSRPTFYDYF